MGKGHTVCDSELPGDSDGTPVRRARKVSTQADLQASFTSSAIKVASTALGGKYRFTMVSAIWFADVRKLPVSPVIYKF